MTDWFMFVQKFCLASSLISILVLHQLGCLGSKLHLFLYCLFGEIGDVDVWVVYSHNCW